MREEGAGTLDGITLPVSIVIHWSIKKSLNICAFSVKSIMNKPFSKRGGVIGILALFKTVLIKDQCLLLEVPGLA